MATGTSLPAGAGAQVVGKVQIIHGTVKAQAADGTVRVLQANDPIFANERIITGTDGMIAIAFGDAANTRLDLGRMSDVLIDEDVFSGEAPADLGDAAAEVASIQQALTNENFDPTTDLEAPAAGAAAADITPAGGSHDYVKFDLTAEELTPVSGAETIGIARGFLDPDRIAVEAEEPVIPEPIVAEEEPEPSPQAAPPSEPSTPEPTPPGPPSPPPPPEPPPTNYIPVAGDVVRTVDEENFADGTSSNPSLLTTKGTLVDLGVEFPGDLPGSLDFGGNKIIVIDSLGDTGPLTIKGKYGTLTVNDDGSWSYTLDDNIAHPDNNPNDGDGTTGIADSLPEVFTFSAVDFNGDSAPGSITINILDDGPVVNLSGGSVTGAVQEDALGNESEDPAAHDNDASIGNLDPGVNTDTVTLNLADLVTITPGADNPATVTFGLTGLGAGVSTSLTSGGSTVYYHQIGNTIVATTSATLPALVTDPNVFTFAINSTTGQAVFNLNDQIDHPNGAGDAANLAITNLGSYVQVSVTDTDGDIATTTLGNAITVTVENDVPAVSITPAAEASVTAQVLEDGLSLTGDPGDPDLSEGYREGGESLTSDEFSGGTNLTTLFTGSYNPIGADEGGTPATPTITTGLDTDISGLATLYSKGEQLSYSVVKGDDADTLTATTTNGTVFTLVVNHDGTWTFDLDDQLDHVEDGDTEGDFLRTSPSDTTGVQGIDFSSILTGTATGNDFDGDQATATIGVDAGSFVVTVVDDVPVINQVADAHIANEPNLILTGLFDVDEGADEPVSASLTSNIAGWDGISVTSVDSGLTSNGQTVYYYVDPDHTDQLLAVTNVNDIETSKVFTLSVDPANDEYTLETFAKLDGQQDFIFDLSKTTPPGGTDKYYLITDANKAYSSLAEVPPTETVILSLSSTNLNEEVQGSTQGIGIDNQWVDPPEQNGDGALVIDFGVPDYDDPSVRLKDSLAIGGYVNLTVDIKSNSHVTVVYTVFGATGDEIGTGSQLLSGSSGTVSITGYDQISAIELAASDGAFRLTGADFSSTSVEFDVLEEFTVAITDADGDTATETIAVEFDNNNVMTGTDEAEVFVGGPEAEIISGGGGDDVITGGPGDDTIDGGEGADTIDGGAGNDTITGDTDGDANDDTYDGGDDTITGGDGNDTIDGGEGNDVIYGEEGDDTIDGEAGDDTISGGDDADTIDGGDGDDIIDGGEGADIVDGEAGDDTVQGGEETSDPAEGNDVVTGGEGADTFAEEEAGEVTDYEPDSPPAGDDDELDNLVPLDPDPDPAP